MKINQSIKNLIFIITMVSGLAIFTISAAEADA